MTVARLILARGLPVMPAGAGRRVTDTVPDPERRT